MLIPKITRWVSRRWLDAARDQPCVLCGAEDGTVVAAHLPSWETGTGAGMGQKTHDWCVADVCAECHRKLDHGEWRRDHATRMRALCLTFQRRQQQGFF